MVSTLFLSTIRAKTLGEAIVCQKCGGTGYAELLVYCVDCQISAEHRYCLDGIQILEETKQHIKWSCWECSQKNPKVASLTKLSVDGVEETQCQDLRVSSSAAVAVKKRCKDSKCFSVDKADGVRSIIQPRSSLLKIEKKKRIVISCSDKGFSVDKAEEVRSTRQRRSESLDIGRDGSLLKVEKRSSLISCSDKSEGERKRKQQRRRLILADGDSSDEDNTHMKIGQDCTDGDATNCRVIRTEEPVGSLSSKDAASPVLEGLQPVFVGASKTMVQASNVCNSPVKNSDCQLPTNNHDYIHAQPIINPVWRGCFDIHNSNYGVIVAHLSSKACSRVFEGANMLPPVLRLEKLPRTNAWPKAFKSTPPTDNHIGLYFFPESVSNGAAFYQLICEIISQDLVLKVVVGEAELLMFSSSLLPLQDSRFCGRFYLWGLFRARQVPPSSLFRASQVPPSGLFRAKQVSPSTIEKPLALSASNAEDVDERWLAKGHLENVNNDRCDTVPPLHFPEEPAKCAKHEQSLEEHFDFREERAACDEKLPGMEAPSRGLYHDVNEKNSSELELFPLEVENMAVMARVGGCGRLDLDLGLGRSTINGGGLCGSKHQTDYYAFLGKTQTE
ncbi:uncharacterized protein LOC131226691 isoform X2 [Magnolia sinica]|uniref:uncharacterized protein LOC131226691 isoform X2 n=1 Tax=Magnolia sinica TaxID=86752 RepID=UPI00265A6C08|nr:uncharacterized protein LOC131226691 isoform X2 [Magnolia sinica]